jgi:hypothetical protein
VGTIKCCLLPNCLSVLYLSLRFPQHFLGACLPGLRRQWVITSLVTGVHPPDHQQKIPPGANIQLDLKGWFILPAVRMRASDTQQNVVRCRNQLGSTAHQIGKNLGSNLDLPQEAAGETDHLPDTTSNCLLGWTLISQVQWLGQVLCYAKVCKIPPRVNRGLNFSWEIFTTEVKGWKTKVSVPKGADSQENRRIIHRSTG